MSKLTLCQRIENSNNIGQSLMTLPLLARSTFALIAPFVEMGSPKFSLAQKIINTTRCVISGKTIVSWNIDSLRSRIIDSKTAKCKIERTILSSSPMGKLISLTHPDIICLQETKLQKSNEKCFNVEGYHTYWNSSTARKGYSGVAIWSKEKPVKVSDLLEGIDPLLQKEGRILTAYYPGYAIVNTYTPNTLRAGTKPRTGWEKVKNGPKRKAEYEKYIGMRQKWDAAILTHLQKLRTEVDNVIWCGDMNVVRSMQDIHNGEKTKIKLQEEKDNKNRPSRIRDLERRIKNAQIAMDKGGGAGLRLEEREGLRRILSRGFSDVYRTLYPEGYGFTYWDRTKIHFRGADNGWRIDYFIVSHNLLPCIENVKVFKDVGVVKTKVPSDHAPLVLKFYPN